MEKILSVVVPTYNMEKYLDRCLSSLIVEDSLMDTLEVIVVNDGSKDNSSQIAHSYEAKYPQTFIVVDKENGNYGSCVNKGLDLATGKYFRILDADDWFDSLALQIFLVFLRTNESDVVVTQYSVINSDGSIEKTEFKHKKELCKLYSLSDDLYPQEWLRMHQVTYLTRLLRQIELKLQCGISYTDTEYCYFPMKTAQTATFTDINLYQYYASREGQSMSVSSRIKSISHMEQVAKRIVNDYVQSALKDNKPYLCLPVYGILLTYYGTAILDCAFSMKTVCSLRRIDKLVRSNKDLYDMTQGFTHEDFHFVAFWRRWGLTTQSLLYKLYKKVK